MKKPKAAIYVRVSTAEQDTDMQETELRDYVEKRGWSCVLYRDKASGVTNDRQAQQAKCFKFWGGRRESNPQRPEPQSGALPVELLPPRTCDYNNSDGVPCVARLLSYYAPDPSGLASLKMTVALEI
jgi:hypothetical protein